MNFLTAVAGWQILIVFMIIILNKAIPALENIILAAAKINKDQILTVESSLLNVVGSIPR